MRVSKTLFTPTFLGGIWHSVNPLLLKFQLLFINIHNNIIKFINLICLIIFMKNKTKVYMEVFNLISSCNEISQPDIVTHLLDKGYYSGAKKSSAKSAVGQILYRMRDKDKVIINRKAPVEKAGSLDMNVWRKL